MVIMIADETDQQQVVEENQIQIPQVVAIQGCNQNQQNIDVSHDVEVPTTSHEIRPSPAGRSPKDELIDSEMVEKYDLMRRQGTILGAADRKGSKVYLIEWSNGEHQILSETEVKEKWPQLLIKFYEENIHWLKNL